MSVSGSTMTADSYVDVDEILARYKRSKSKLVFLVCAIGFIFLGTIGGYFSLQLSTSRLEEAQLTVIEFAEVTVKSDHCVSVPTDSVCVKAQEILREKSTNLNPTGKIKQEPMFVIGPESTDLGPGILQQPVILRIQ